MKLEIEVPEVTCCRCSKVAAVMPVALKRTAGAAAPGAVSDSAGNAWTPSGALFPAGWTQAPTDATKALCDECTPIVTAAMNELLAPPKPALAPPVKTAAASIPTMAKSVGNVVRSFPTPAQAVKSTQGAQHYAKQETHPSHSVAAAPTILQPPSVSRPTPGVVPKLAAQASTAVVGVPTVRAPITPVEKATTVQVSPNANYPQPKTGVPVPVPQAAERALPAPLANEALDPIVPDTTRGPRAA